MISIRLNNISRRRNSYFGSRCIRCSRMAIHSSCHRRCTKDFLRMLSLQCNSLRVWRGAADISATGSSTASARVAPRSQGAQRASVLRWTLWRSVPHLLHAVLDLCPASPPSLGLHAIYHGLVALAAKYSPPFSTHPPRPFLLPSALFALTMGPLQFHTAPSDLVLWNCSCRGRGQMEILVAQHLQCRLESRKVPK
jgi:hypothetical protein